MFDVACVIVNYNSGRLCRSAVDSLFAQRFSGRDGRAGSLQVVVVDNASPVDQRGDLDPLRARGVDVIYHDENAGYGGGMNLGLAHVDAEFVLLANPDVLVLDGAVERLVALLRHDASVGLVGPRGYLDPGLFVMLPTNDLPSLDLHVWESLGRVHRRVAERAATDRSRRFLRAWTANEPLEMSMVSGFAMALRTDVARALGPFDPAFPFYFEDADLCRRLRREGLRVLLEPRARMVHFFDQSARSARDEVKRKYDVSRGHYYRKHYGESGMRVFHAMNRYASRYADAGEGWRFHDVEEFGDVERSPRIALPRETSYLMEIATDPSFLFCAGHVDRGDAFEFPAASFACLDATRWYVRVLDRADLSILRFVTFEKTTPALPPTTYEAFAAAASRAEGGAS